MSEEQKADDVRAGKMAAVTREKKEMASENMDDVPGGKREASGMER